MSGPQGVRIVRGDGTVLECELVHIGIDKDGMDQWEIANATFNLGVDSVKIDMLPARTGIRFATSTVFI